MMDEITNAIDNGDYVIGIFLISRKHLTRLTRVFYLRNYAIMEFEATLLIGLEVICPTENNL